MMLAVAILLGATSLLDARAVNPGADAATRAGPHHHREDKAGKPTQLPSRDHRRLIESANACTSAKKTPQGCEPRHMTHITY